MVEVKLLADSDCLGVIFRVSDEVVRTEATEYCGSVWKDSCVEMFIAPAQSRPSIESQYFNFEISASRVMLLYHCRGGTEHTPVALEDGASVKIASTVGAAPVLPTSSTCPQCWVLEYHVPWALFAKYFGADVAPPLSGAAWTANFYKCGGVRPHYGCWSELQPKRTGTMGAFHSPESFGQLLFE